MKKRSILKKNYTAACVCCGKLIEENSIKIFNGKNYCETCSVVIEKGTFEFNAPEGFLRIFSYILSFLNPFIGFLFGAIYFSQKQNISAKTFGKNCLILMTISFSFILLFLILSIFIGSTISGGDLFYNIKEGYY